MKIGTINGVEELNGKQLTVTVNNGSLTAQYCKENGYAIVTKMAGQEGKNVQFNSPNEIIDFSVVAELEAYLDAKFEAAQTVINTEI